MRETIVTGPTWFHRIVYQHTVNRHRTYRSACTRIVTCRAAMARCGLLATGHYVTEQRLGMGYWLPLGIMVVW